MFVKQFQRLYNNLTKNINKGIWYNQTIRKTYQQTPRAHSYSVNTLIYCNLNVLSNYEIKKLFKQFIHSYHFQVLGEFIAFFIYC